MTEASKPDWLTENADHSLTVHLSRNYILSDQTTRDTITLREPTVADQKAFMPNAGTVTPRQQAETEAKMLASLADNIPPAFFDTLALRDYQRLQAAFGFFLD